MTRLLKQCSADVRALNHDVWAAVLTPDRCPVPQEGVSEEAEQVRLFDLLAVAALDDARLRFVFHIPNGGHRRRGVGGRLKALGVRAGVPDLFVPVPVGGYHGLWVELKAPGGRVRPVQRCWLDYLQAQVAPLQILFTFTTVQRCWLDYLQAQGYAVAVCVGADEALQAILDYLQHGIA